MSEDLKYRHYTIYASRDRSHYATLTPCLPAFLFHCVSIIPSCSSPFPLHYRGWNDVVNTVLSCTLVFWQIKAQCKQCHVVWCKIRICNSGFFLLFSIGNKIGNDKESKTLLHTAYINNKVNSFQMWGSHSHSFKSLTKDVLFRLIREWKHDYLMMSQKQTILKWREVKVK